MLQNGDYLELRKKDTNNSTEQGYIKKTKILQKIPIAKTSNNLRRTITQWIKKLTPKSLEQEQSKFNIVKTSCGKQSEVNQGNCSHKQKLKAELLIFMGLLFNYQKMEEELTWIIVIWIYISTALRHYGRYEM